MLILFNILFVINKKLFVFRVNLFCVLFISISTKTVTIIYVRNTNVFIKTSTVLRLLNHQGLYD